MRRLNLYKKKHFRELKFKPLKVRVIGKGARWRYVRDDPLDVDCAFTKSAGSNISSFAFGNLQTSTPQLKMRSTLVAALTAVAVAQTPAQPTW